MPFSIIRRSISSAYARPLLTSFQFCNHTPYDTCPHRSYSRRGTQNHYDVLDVSPKATQAQIKSAYFVLSKKYHPDLNKSEEAKVKFAQISEAYAVIGNAVARGRYDRGFSRPDVHTSEVHTHESLKFDKFKRQTFKTKQATFKMGHTDIYNYDEFYRQHYADTIGKMKRAKAAAEEQHRKDDEKIKEVVWHKAAFTFLCILGIIAALNRYEEYREDNS